MKSRRQERQERSVEAIFADDLKRLREFTKECRPDMHEPDEQGITAKYGPSVEMVTYGGRDVHVSHPQLDNACTGEHPGTDMGFWLFKEMPDGGKAKEWFNLADLIALARR